MAGLRCGLLLFLMPCLVQLTDQYNEPKNCGKVIAESGTPAKIPCSADNNLTYVRVGPFTKSTCIGDTFLNTTYPTSQDGRLQLTWSGNTANLLINSVNRRDAGAYCFYLKTKDSAGAFYRADLQIEEIPQIFVEWMDMKIVCRATGGYPVGTIQWADGFGTNWTQSATSENKNGVLTSTLLLQKSSVMAEYYCRVTYRYLNKTESQTCHIAKGNETQCEERSSPIIGGSEKPTYAMYFLVAVPVLICALLALWFYCRRRSAHQANDVLGQSSSSNPLVMNDIEMAAGSQSSETAILNSSPST